MQVLPGGHDDIESVRLIRDSESLLCKGVGYLLLRTRDAVIKALSLHQVNSAKTRLQFTIQLILIPILALFDIHETNDEHQLIVT